MEILELLYLMTARALTGWALREIDPLHPDLPKLVLRQKAASVQLRSL
jgi:hypothetical protein